MTKRYSWAADPPPWNNFDRKETRNSWLEYIDLCLDHLFQEEQAETELEPDLADNLYTEKLNKYAKARLSDNERRALLAGINSNTASKWRPLAELMRAGNTSLEFDEILADMIEFNGFHPKTKFNKAHIQESSELVVYNHFNWIFDVLRMIYPERSSKALIARAKKVVANFITDDDSSISLAEAERQVRHVTSGWESDPERVRLTLLRARVETGEQFMLGRCRAYRR